MSWQGKSSSHRPSRPTPPHQGGTERDRLTNPPTTQPTSTKGTSPPPSPLLPTNPTSHSTPQRRTLTNPSLPPRPSLVGTGNVDKAAIFNAEGNSVWATSAGFTVSPQEMQEVVAAYRDPGKDGVKQVQSTGLHVAGERFVVLKADERSIYGKKVSSSFGSSFFFFFLLLLFRFRF